MVSSAQGPRSTDHELLLLLDGYSLLFRAFYALREPVMRTEAGVATNALFGFSSMLANVVAQERPTLLVVALDAEGPTFRDAILESYKGTRAPTPDDLRLQLDAARGLLEAIAVPALEVTGFEADDVIATLATQARDAGIRTRIVTGDRDLLQLVEDPLIAVLLTRKGVSNLEVFDEAKVLETYGVPPARYGDLAALRGDSSDNLPGVPGIGPKTAAALLDRFGSIEGIFAHLDALTPRQRAALESARSQLLEGRLLTQLRRDVVSLPPLEALRLGPWDSRRAEALMVGTFELRRPFQALMRAFDGRPQLDVDPRPADSPLPSLTDVDISGLMERLRPGVVVAATAGFQGDPGRSRVVELALAVDDVVWAGSPDEADQRLWPMLEACTLVGAGPKEIVRSLVMENRVPLRPPELVDLEVLGWLADSADVAHGLDQLAQRWLARRLDERGPLEAEATPLGARRHIEAVDLIRQALERRLRHDDLWSLAAEVEIPLTRVLTDMEIHGVAIDRAALDEIGTELAAERDDALREVHRYAGGELNPNSPRQLAVVLFERLGLPAGRKTKTGYSTDARVLETLRDAHPIVAAILRFRELDKLLSTFYEGLRSEISDDGRIHATFNQAVARTGRISSERPNLQNIPVRTDEGKRFRDAFVAAEGRVLVAADYSQIELRVLAHLSGDEELVRILSADGDVHALVAARVFGVPVELVTTQQRSVAKMVTYGLSYGMEAYGLAQRLGVQPAEAEGILGDFFAAFPGLRRYRESSVEAARAQGFTTTLLGRRRYLPDLDSSNRTVRQSAERQAMNAGTQGLAADIFKIALVRLHTALDRSDGSLVLQVHDEVVVEAAEERAHEVRRLVEDVLEHAYTLRVPLRVQSGIGRSWGRAKSDG